MCQWIYLGLLVITVSAGKDKPKITVPSSVVRTIPNHYLWCSVEGSPPINISLLKNSTLLVHKIGKLVTQKAEEEGIYTCLASSEAGSNSKEFLVTFVGCENCSGNDTIEWDHDQDQVKNDFSCRNIGSTIDIGRCLPTTTTHLYLQQNNISNLTSGIFSKLTYLKYL
ncbi:hypothetical protein ACROYT_G028712 [Oculina patagonica]